MPFKALFGIHYYRRRTWKTMNRHARKSWYREEEARVARGLKPRRKPKVVT